MIKKGMMFFVFCTGCLTGFGEISEQQLRDYSRILSIDSVSNKRLRERGAEAKILRVDFSGGEEQSAELLEQIIMRVAVEITDLRSKKTYFAEKMYLNGKFSYDYTGEGYWEFLVPCKTLKRIKISAYTVQYGVANGRNFIPFDEKLYNVDSYDELKTRTSAAYPEECELSRTQMVED